MNSRKDTLGYVVGGGLRENLRARLTISSQNIQEGAFVTIDNENWRYFGLVTDIQLGATDPRFADEQSEQRLPPHLSRLLHGQTLFTNLEILPVLMLDRGPDPERDPKGALNWEPSMSKPIAVKTVPPHHSIVLSADAADIAAVYGDPDEKGKFTIGYTREQGHPVAIDLDLLVQRSAGVFGATGTGKSFLTMVLMAGLMKHNEVSLLIFDMHNEYGFDVEDKSDGHKIPGLAQKFTNTKIVGLGSGKNSIYRNRVPDINLEIAASDIQPEDIELLSRELNLRETASSTLHALVSSFGKNWLVSFMSLESKPKIDDPENERRRIYPDGSIEAWAEENNIHVEAAKMLHNRLRKIYAKDYVVDDPASNGIDQIIDSLLNKRNVILSFGKYDNDLDYLLVTNLLTRKIRAKWETLVTQSDAENSARPRPLVIVVEEAHKLLNRELASQTTFSTIARELRKYNVTLLIVDQRPSQIYDEVMSQLGTRITGWLGDDDDIRAVLTGLPNRDNLRGMLARLEAAQEILLLGPWGIKMPLPVKSQRFGDTFWEQLLGKKAGGGKKTEEERKKELGF